MQTKPQIRNGTSTNGKSTLLSPRANQVLQKLDTLTKPFEIANAMAEQCQPDGSLDLTVRLRLFPVTLITLARRARHKGTSIEDVFVDAVQDASNKWENEMPD